MGRNTGPVCRLCRREGLKLFLKGARCFGPKCAFSRRESPPGVHPWQRRKPSEYAIRLREKQKVKRFYGVFDGQFRRYFDEALQAKGPTGEALLRLLERRLDNVVYRLGFVHSRAHARQMIGHGHVTVNGKRSDRPGRLVKVGEKIAFVRGERIQKVLQEAREAQKEHEVPSWLKADREGPAGEVLALPTREEIPIDVREQLIVELASR